MNAVFEASGINDAARGGEALGRGDLKTAGVFLALTFGGQAIKAGKLLKNVDGGMATADEALGAATKWLGEGYTEIAEGVFRSANNARQFRMTVSDLTDKKLGQHVHFEAIGPDGKTIIENSHVRIQP